jgi:hypothetical protein
LKARGAQRRLDPYRIRIRRYVSQLQSSIVKVIRAGFLPDHRVLHGAFSRLEPCAVKVACTVLRGRGGGNATLPPDPNPKLASGFCQVARLLVAGVKVALGTDGAASNNDLEMRSELRVAALLGKGVAWSASAVPALAVLRLLTINASRALGTESEIGTLEPGKTANLLALELRDPDTQPVYQSLAQIVYAASRAQVHHVCVVGWQLRDGVAPTPDREAILTQARDWGGRIAVADRGPEGQCVGRGWAHPTPSFPQDGGPRCQGGTAAVCCGGGSRSGVGGYGGVTFPGHWVPVSR